MITNKKSYVLGQEVRSCMVMDDENDFLGHQTDIVKDFFKMCDEYNIDVEDGFEDDKFREKSDGSIRTDFLKWIEDGIADKQVVSNKPPKMVQVNGEWVVADSDDRKKKVFTLTRSEKNDLLKMARVVAAIRDTKQMETIINSKDTIDVEKFKRMVDILFDNLIQCYNDFEKDKAKKSFAHAMVNTKRLLAGKDERNQQMFGLWSADKGVGKDVLFYSWIHALTGKDVVSHDLDDLTDKFNADLAQTKGIYYISEFTNVEKNRKNEIKKLVTAKNLSIEYKGKEKISVPRRFTICLSANEDPSSVFHDENKERRNGFVKIIGTNYYYTSKALENDEIDIELVLEPFFYLMWLYCPIKYYYDPAEVTEIAQTDSERQVFSGLELFKGIKEIANNKSAAAFKDNLKGDDSLKIAKNIMDGKRFTQKQLQKVLIGTQFERWEIKKVIGSDYVTPLAGSYYKLNLDYYKKQEDLDSKGSMQEVKPWKKPLVTINVDELCECIYQGKEFVFPTPKFKDKSGEVVETRQESKEIIPNRLQRSTRTYCNDWT